MKHERVDIETEVKQRQVAADYFIDLTDALADTLQDFCEKSDILIHDGNSNPAILITFATAAALETDHAAKVASTMATILRDSLLPITDHTLNENLLPSISRSSALLQTLVSSYANIPETKAVKAAEAHKNLTLQEATLWHLTKAVALFSAFAESLTTIQMALKDYNYAQLSQTDKEIKRIFDSLIDRYASEHQKDIQNYISDVTSAVDAIHDLKSDYRTNPAVAQYIKSSSDLPKIIRNLRETHQTESILPDFLAFVTKYETLQNLAKKQKKAAKSQPPIQATVNLNIDHFINNGTFTDNSVTLPPKESKLLNE